MQRIKPWQTAAVAVIAIGIALTFIWHTYAQTQAVPPIPAAFSGTPPAVPKR